MRTSAEQIDMFLQREHDADITWDSPTHVPDEHVRLQDFLNGARHIARIIDGFTGL